MFRPTGFSEEIFKQRYAFTEDESWDSACNRVARQVALAESPDKFEKYYTKFKTILEENLFAPAGRIWYNSGRPNPFMLNCFVLNDELDSKEGWGDISREMIITSMCGGGSGINFSDVRPRGAKIKGQRGECPGPIELMKLINGNGIPIKAGGSRRVALMFGLDITHPDIEEFLDAKLKFGKLDNANISVIMRNTTEFKKLVEEDGQLELSWKGKYKKNISAKKLWNKIVKNAYNTAEPGVINMELAENESNLHYLERLSICNPCGEVIMTPHESCDLGHLVLPRFVRGTTQVNWELLGETIRTGVRFLDNILDINSYPLPEMKKKGQKYRRLGLGTTGLADMLALLGYRYGSTESNDFIDKLYRFISKVAYESSIMLAVEKGAFPACRPEEHIKSGYIKRMSPKIKNLILDHGIRNSSILTIAPVGTVSILSGNCSSGIEPMFAPAYERRFFVKDERKMELVFHPLFKLFMEEGKDVSHFVGANDLTAREHLEVQRVIQRHVDNAISKTCNIPKDYRQKDMSKIWLEYLTELKGTTFYRESSRGYIDENGEMQEPPLKALSLDEAQKRYDKDAKEAAIEQQCASGICEL